MYMFRSLTLITLSCVATPSFSQHLVSPEVHKDGRVTFRLRATNADKVLLRLESAGELALQKDAQGVWSVTSKVLTPDIYVYSFRVDGRQMIDPSNPFIKYNLFNTESQVHVPGAKPLVWENDQVPHGVMHRHLYRSAIIGEDRPFQVYTPPAYDREIAAPYPVLYLLHGFSDAEDAWVSIGRANLIIDNLLAQGKIKPMVVVMPLGYGNRKVISQGWQGLRDRAAWLDSNDKFREALLAELIPQVEAAYHVSKDRRYRAITGLSMGGTQSLMIGLNALDRFAWIGAFSSGGLNANFSEAYPAVNTSTRDQLRLLWIACGREDGLIGSNRELVAWLKSQEVDLTWKETSGSHSFMVWRRYLAEFLPLLFRE